MPDQQPPMTTDAQNSTQSLEAKPCVVSHQREARFTSYFSSSLPQIAVSLEKPVTLLLDFGLNTEIAFPVKVQKEKIEKNTEYRNRFGTGYFCKATRPKEGIGKTRSPTTRKMNVLGSS